jgi:hypothetical protein
MAERDRILTIIFAATESSIIQHQRTGADEDRTALKARAVFILIDGST